MLYNSDSDCGEIGNVRKPSQPWVSHIVVCPTLTSVDARRFHGDPLPLKRILNENLPSTGGPVWTEVILFKVIASTTYNSVR